MEAGGGHRHTEYGIGSNANATIAMQMPTLPLLYIVVMARRKVLLSYHFLAVTSTQFSGQKGEIWREESEGLSRQAFSNVNFKIPT